MIIDEGHEHLRVVTGAEDALDDDVEAVTERVPRHEVDQPDVRPCGHVVLAQHVAAQVVLPDDGKVPAAVPPADSAAVDDLPDAEFPRKMISRVSPEPVPVTPAKLALFRAGRAGPGPDGGPARSSCPERPPITGQTVHGDLRFTQWRPLQLRQRRPRRKGRLTPAAAGSGTTKTRVCCLGNRLNVPAPGYAASSTASARKVAVSGWSLPSRMTMTMTCLPNPES